MKWTTLRWGPLSGRDAVPSLVDSQGYLPLETDVVSQRAKPQEVDRELRAQIDFARAAGVNITHLDSHMAALFQTEALYGVYHNLGKSYGLPQLIERLGARGGEQAPAWAVQARADALVDRVLGMAPGVAPDQWLDAYKKMLTPLAPGVYELIVHLGHDDDEMRGATSDHPNWRGVAPVGSRSGEERCVSGIPETATVPPDHVARAGEGAHEECVALTVLEVVVCCT